MRSWDIQSERLPKLLAYLSIRYYEKEGIMPSVKRNDSGIRIYEKVDLEVLQFIRCLKETGMPVIDIKKFVNLLVQGDHTIEDRIDLLQKQKENVQSQVEQLLSYIQMLDGKVQLYQTILANKNEYQE